MLDTVQVKHYFPKPISEDELRQLGAKGLPTRRLKTFVLNPDGNEPLPRITIVFTPDGIMHVSAECSIPRLLFGHNARLPSQDEVKEGMQCLGDFVETRTGLPFDPETATVSLVHYARDIQLGEPGVYAAIRKLSQRKLVRYDSLLYNSSTLYFNAKGKATVIRIYPKFAEVRCKKRESAEAIEAARGKLRIELCLLKSRRIDSLVKSLKLSDKTAKTLLTSEISETLISKLLADLSFDVCLKTGRSNLEILQREYKRAKAYRLNSFIQAIELYGEKFYLDPKHDLSKYTYDRDARDCIRANVWIGNKSLE